MELRKIRRINIRYLITVFLVFSVAAFENVKSFIFTTVDKLIDILFYPLFLLSKILKILFDKIRIEEDIKKTEEVLEEVLENNQIEEMGEFLGEQSNGFDFTIIINIIMFLLVVAAIYAIYKVIVKTGAKQYKTAEFIEEREYIKNPKRKRKLFKRDKLPSELKGQIRYYYRKYLEKLIRENIDIRKSDTTLDIQTKAEEVYLDINEKIRQIYIESRYGQKKVDREKVEEMKELYKSFRP